MRVEPFYKSAQTFILVIKINKLHRKMAERVPLSVSVFSLEHALVSTCTFMLNKHLFLYSFIKHIQQTMLSLLFFVLFEDICCKLRPANDRREPSAITSGGALSPIVSPHLGNIAVCKDGSVGMPVYITVMNIQQIKNFPFEDVGSSCQ